jgi:O-antigen/teichoic acid export membrane protein
MKTTPGRDAGALASRAISGSFWMGGSMAVAQVVRLGSDLILVRLLSPSDFGLVALMGAMIALTESFTQTGLDASVIRSARGDESDFLNTAWTVQVIRGFALWGVVCVLTWPISILYGSPQLRTMLPVMSLGLVLNGFTSTSLLFLGRHLSLRIPMLLFLGQQVVAVAVMLAWALIVPSVWALVAGSLAGIAFIAGLSHFAVPDMKVRFRWDPAAWRELFHFGKWIFAGSMISSLGSQIDDLVLGRLAPMSSLGVYDVSAKYPFVIRRAAFLFARYLLLPTLSRHHEQDPERFRDRVAETRGVFSLIGLIPILVLFFYGPYYFGALFPKDYATAGWICRLLTITIWFTLLKMSAERVLLVLGDAKATAVANVWWLAASAAGLVAGFLLGGMTGFALGLAFGSIISHLYVQWALARRGVAIFAQDLLYTCLAVGITLLGTAVPALALAPLGDRARTAGTIAVSTAVLLGFVGIAGRRMWRGILGR